MKNYDNPVYYADLIDYIANPADQRTWKEFSLAVGVEYDVILRFRNSHAETIEADVNNVRSKYIGAIRSVALKSLFNRIQKSDAALKMALTITGDLVERTENVTVVRTPEEKRARINELMEKLSNSGK